MRCNAQIQMDLLNARYAGLSTIVTLVWLLSGCGPSERDAALARYKELMETGEKWATELRGEAPKVERTLAEACAGKLAEGKSSSVVGYVAKMAQKKTDTTFAYPDQYAVVPSSMLLGFENIPRALKNPDEQLETLGEFRYVVVTTEREVRMPAFVHPDDQDRPAGVEHEAWNSFATLYIGVYDWQKKSLICSGHARADMPEKFISMGFGKDDSAARTAQAVSLGAMGAISSEIRSVGIQLICAQISSGLCKSIERAKP